MVYLKSLIAGIAVLLITMVVAIFASGLYMYFASRSTEDGAIGWDPISLKKPLIWIFAILIFAGGFLWEFRRATK